jgi:hypothetical protein
MEAVNVSETLGSSLSIGQLMRAVKMQFRVGGGRNDVLLRPVG